MKIAWESFAVQLDSEAQIRKYEFLSIYLHMQFSICVSIT